ncbi:hypothetical protein GCM10020258_00620 [Sphingomonas yabuuchiae]
MRGTDGGAQTACAKRLGDAADDQRMAAALGAVAAQEDAGNAAICEQLCGGQPAIAIGQLHVAKRKVGPLLINQRHGGGDGVGNADHAVTVQRQCVLDQHGDQRLILDNQEVQRGFVAAIVIDQFVRTRGEPHMRRRHAA